VTGVLLVDDDAAYRRALASFLDASYDIRVVGETGDAAEAVELAASLLPDAAVVDLAMPGPGGLDAAEKIAAVSPETVVIIVTGTDEDEARRQTAQLTVAAVIHKGDPLQVENALRSLTRRAH
jgi:two-component system, NarL family, response regulator DesR